MELRNRYVTKFLVYNKTKYLLALLLDILKSWNTKNAYTKPDNDNIYMEFQNERDMANACLYTYSLITITI